MPIRDILVHVDTSSSCRARLQLAGQIAQRLEAYLLGIGSDSGGAAEDRFDALLSSLNLPGEWHSATDLIAPSVVEMAAAADLVILGQPDPDRLLVELNTPEDVILACGRPVLMVPYVGHFADVGNGVLAAWNGSREATRAIHDSLPLMPAAKAVIVLSVDPSLEDDTEREILVRHLARHALPTAGESIGLQGRAIAEAVNARAIELGCDLIVMGAYGHSRLRETVLGGMTYGMLNSMALPVLMTH